MRWPALGFRREVSIIYVVSTLLLVFLVTFTILAFHSALDRLVEERRLEAAGLASGIADQVSATTLPSVAELRRAAPGALAVALIDSDGTPILVEGPLVGVPNPARLMANSEVGPVGLGPDLLFRDRVIGMAPTRWRGQIIFARVDLIAAGLANQMRSLRVLTWVVFSTSLAIPILVLYFLRYFLSPYEKLLEKARRVGKSDEGDDEMSFLLSTVERAFESLTMTHPQSSEDDILALERTLGPSLQSGLLIMDHKGGVLALNAIGAELLGIELRHPGTPFDSLLEPHDDLRTALERVVKHQTQVRRLELAVESEAGSRALGLTVHVLRRNDGAVRGYLALFIDLTEIQRRNEEEKVARSLSQVGELAAGMAHELRNSLGTLRGYLTLIGRRPNEEKIEDYLAEIRRETDHLQRVLEDFLSFARPGTARMETVDLVEIIRRASADPSLEGKPVDIYTDLDPAKRELCGDSQLLERAFRNLLHNASRAETESGHEGPLEVHIRWESGSLEARFLDRGPGLPEEIRNKLFEPFTTTHPEGVGLGLALSHRIIDLHGGRLTLESRQLGGTCAVIWLPAGSPMAGLVTSQDSARVETPPRNT